MAERDPIAEFAVVQQKYASEAEGHFRDLPDDLKQTWHSARSGMNTMNIDANGAASRLEKMSEDRTSLGPDPHRVMHDFAEQGSRQVAEHHATTLARLDVFENLLKAASRPSVPSDPQRQNLLRDDLRTKLSGTPADQQLTVIRAIASGEDRELAGLLNSAWGTDYVASLGHRGKEIETVIHEETIRGSAQHGVGREKAAALALSVGMPAARKAFLASHLRAKSVIDKVRPGQPLIGTINRGY
jgi:hypothetical protein